MAVEDMNEKILKQIRLQRMRIHEQLCSDMKQEYYRTRTYKIMVLSSYLMAFVWLGLMYMKLNQAFTKGKIDQTISFAFAFLPLETLILIVHTLVIQ